MYFVKSCRLPYAVAPRRRLSNASSSTYKILHDAPPTTATGVCPPQGGNETLPFFVERTGTGNLPVYSDVRNARSKKLTIVRGVRGDAEELVKAMHATLDASLKIEYRIASIEIEGDHVANVKHWLLQMGF